MNFKSQPHLFKIRGGQIVFSFRNIGIVLTQLALINLQGSLVIPGNTRVKAPYFLINQLICCS